MAIRVTDGILAAVVVVLIRTDVDESLPVVAAFLNVVDMLRTLLVTMTDVVGNQVDLVAMVSSFFGDVMGKAWGEAVVLFFVCNVDGGGDARNVVAFDEVVGDSIETVGNVCTVVGGKEGVCITYGLAQKGVSVMAALAMHCWFFFS